MANAQPNSKPQQQPAIITTAPVVPMSEEAERATLAGVMTNPNTFYELVSFLKPEDFFLVRHRYIFEAMQAISQRNQPPGDYLLLIEELRTRGQLDLIGGAAYLTKLSLDGDSTLTTVYGHLVERAAIRRQLMAYGQEVSQAAADESAELSEVINQAEQKQVEIVSRYTGANTQSLHQAVSAFYDRVEKLMNSPNQTAGIPSGFTDLDRVLLGFEGQALTLLGGRPGMGKTAMMLTMALNMAKAGYRVAYFSLEMGVDQLVGRLVAMETGINGQSIRTGKLSPPEWSKFVEASGNLSKYPLFIDDTTTWTPIQLHAKCASLKRRLGLQAVFIDYAGLMSGGGRYKDNKVAESGYISRSLKGLARDLRVPVIAAVQLSRKCEERSDKRPVLSDLRDSGEYEQDADNVLFVYRDEVYNEATEFPGQADIIIAKHRNGPVGTVSLYYDKPTTKFANAAWRTVDLTAFDVKGGDE